MTGGAARSYQFDATLGDRVFDLLEVVFPGVGAGRANGAAFGAAWESVSTPFVAERSGRIVAHVGLMPMPLHMRGRTLQCGGVHGVATDPDHRRRGYFRRLMEELLVDGSARFDTLILTTAHREYFEPFGFRVVPESVFRYRSPVGGREPSRVLDLARPEDFTRMHGLLDERTPVSDVLGVGPRGKRLVVKSADIVEATEVPGKVIALDREAGLGTERSGLAAEIANIEIVEHDPVVPVQDHLDAGIRIVRLDEGEGYTGDEIDHVGLVVGEANLGAVALRGLCARRLQRDRLIRHDG